MPGLKKLITYKINSIDSKKMLSWFISIVNFIFVYITWHLIKITTFIEWHLKPKYLATLKIKEPLSKSNELLDNLNRVIGNLEIYKITELLAIALVFLAIFFNPHSRLKWINILVTILIVVYSLMIRLG